MNGVGHGAAIAALLCAAAKLWQKEAKVQKAARERHRESERDRQGERERERASEH